MKKKIFILVVVIIAIIITTIICIKLLNKSGNNENYDKYDVIASIIADKTSVKPGDEITIKLSIEKMPDNGLGIKGINARIAYDPTKITIQQTEDDRGHICPYIVPGNLGEDMNIYLGTAGTVTDVEAGYISNINYDHKVIGIGVINDHSSTILGDVVEIKFTVNEGATGNLGMFVYPDDPMFSGFNVVGVELDENGNSITDAETSFYLNTNLEEVCVD